MPSYHHICAELVLTSFFSVHNIFYAHRYGRSPNPAPTTCQGSTGHKMGIFWFIMSTITLPGTLKLRLNRSILFQLYYVASECLLFFTSRRLRSFIDVDSATSTKRACAGTNRSCRLHSSPRRGGLALPSPSAVGLVTPSHFFQRKTLEDGDKYGWDQNRKSWFDDSLCNQCRRSLAGRLRLPVSQCL